MHYHAALILQATGRRETAREIMTALARRDPGYDGSRYFATFHSLSPELLERLERSRVQLLG